MLKRKLCVFAILMSIMGVSSFGIVSGAESLNNNNKITIVNLNTAIKDIKQWDYYGENASLKDNSLVFSGDEKRDMFGYKGRKYSNEILSFNVKMEIKDGNQMFHIMKDAAVDLYFRFHSNHS